jgi:antitoxin ParD1/3/4
MATNIALSPHFDAFIQQQLASGSYSDASEVVRDGLRLLERQQREDALKLQALQRAAAEGVAALDAGHYIELDATGIEAHIAALGSSNGG